MEDAIYIGKEGLREEVETKYFLDSHKNKAAKT